MPIASIYSIMNIAILSRGEQLYSTRSLVKAAEGRGHTVRLLDVQQCVLSLKTLEPQIIYEGSILPRYDAVIPRIGTSITNLGATVIRQFEAMGIFTTTPSNALLQSRDKLSAFQILAPQGIGVPKTIYPDSFNDPIQEVNELGGFPVIIKTLSSTHGEGVLLVNNKQELHEIMLHLNRTNNRFIIQEFIKECKGEDIRAFIVNGELVACMKRTAAPGDFRSNLHMGGTAKPHLLYHKTKELAIKACELVGLYIAGVDIIESDRGPLILEINASPGLEGIENTTKVDIAGKIIEFIENRKDD